MPQTELLCNNFDVPTSYGVLTLPEKTAVPPLSPQPIEEGDQRNLAVSP